MSAHGAGAVPTVTVTANAAVDQTISVPRFRIGEVNRVVREELSPGGKGVNVAAFLHAYGLPVVATGFLGTFNAALFEAFFDAQGITHRFIRVTGATRTGIKIVDDEAGTTTDLNFRGLTVGEEQLAALERTLASAVTAGTWVVLAGSLPPGAPVASYRRMAEIVHQHGGRVALDTSGPALADALATRPDLIKPNRDELEELVGHRLTDRQAVARAAGELAERGIHSVVVSLGAEGAIFVSGGRTVFARPPRVRVASTVGAGDAMVSGSVAGALQGLALDELAALATAFSAVAISQIGPKLDAPAVRAVARTVTVEEGS